MFPTSFSSVRRTFFIAAVAIASVAAIVPTQALAKGGSTAGGGSTPKVVESRVTGYATAIDYSTGTITVGASYYGSGALHVTSSTSISVNNVNAEFSDIKLGDWVEARFIYSTKEATKLSVTR